MGKIKSIIVELIEEQPLSLRHRDHELIGNYKGRRECHIEADWLLIYLKDKKTIIFERTGSHSDLF